MLSEIAVRLSVVVAIVAGLIAAAAAISARGDRTSWGPGWMLLGVVSLAMFALAMASRPLDEPIKDTRPKGTDPQDIGVQDEVRTFRTSALDPDPAQSLSPPAPSQPAESQPVALEPAPTRAAQTYVGESLSDRSIVASAQAAAAVRTAPSAQRHSLAPLAQAHHFDPSTGLLSAAGLQHAIERAFDVPRQAGHVTIMMFTIRDLGRIEDEQGRLASAAVTREVAKRVNALLPGGSGARFAQAAYAVVFVGDQSDANETIQRLAQVLVQLSAPVEGASLGAKMDVVAGMAQCYESEDAAQFVKRANLGLARAMQSLEPTLVAMP